MRKKRRDYSMIKTDLLTEKVEPVRVRVNSCIDIDYSVFQKTEAEKLKLKQAKARAKETCKQQKNTGNEISERTIRQS